MRLDSYKGSVVTVCIYLQKHAAKSLACIHTGKPRPVVCGAAPGGWRREERRGQGRAVGDLEEDYAQIRRRRVCVQEGDQEEVQRCRRHF